MTSLLYQSARRMIADLAAKRISARELLEAHIARNDALHARLNAVVTTDFERARRDADIIDNARARGAILGVLAGLPMTIKDGFDVENMPAIAGDPQLADRSKNCADADVVIATRAQDAVIWGKTNVPFMLGDFQSYNDVYGTTNNPYDPTRTPAGSSGGAATALAAGITPLEIGSDIGGSLRHPANYCGVYSLKPTWGALSLRGHVPPRPGHYVELDLGVAGPMARNPGDLRLLWNVLRGSAGAAPRPVKDARIVVWDEEPGFPLANSVKEAVRRAADALAAAGVRVERMALPVSGTELMDVYLIILTPIIAAGFPDDVFQNFESMRNDDLAALRNGSGISAAAAYRLRATASYREILAAMARRQAMKDKLAAFFAQGIDGILSPISIVPPFPHLQQPGFNERMLDVDGRSVPYMLMLSWISLATALHGPALALPAGRTDTGLPVGVQIVGPAHGEDRLFDFAYELDERTGGFHAPVL